MSVAKSKTAVRTHSPSHPSITGSTPAGATLPARLSLLIAGALLLLAPRGLSSFWPSTYDYQPQATLLAVTACVCLLMALRPRPPRRAQRIEIVAALLLAFFAWSCLSIITSVYIHDTLLETTRVAAVVAWFFIIRALLREAPQDSIFFYFLSAITGGAVITSIPAIINFIQTKDPRQFSTFYNPNLFANYCAMALPLALAWGITAFRVKPKTIPAGLLAAMAVLPVLIIILGLLVTSSKGGLLAALAALLMFAVALWRAQGTLLKKTLRARRGTVIVVGLVLLIVGGAVASRTVLPRLHQLRGSDDNSTMFRYYTWRGTLQMATARPVLGWGAGSFPSAYAQFAVTGYTRSAHQLWLQIAAENGFSALLLLIGTCLAAALKGWRALRSTAWPAAAGGLGALVAFAVHGLTDAGWGITSIALLLLVVLALLDAPESKADEPQLDASPPTHHSALNWPWVIVSLLLGLASAGTQRAALAEDLRAEARQAMTNRAAQTALEKAAAATDADPLSARMWSNRALIEEANNRNPRFSYEQARRRQPTRATHLLNMAQAVAEKTFEWDTPAGALFDQAVALEPNETKTRLARAQWLLNHNDARGWQDLEYIARLADQPYGKYPAIVEIVNLDFAQAYAKLAARALRNGKKSEASKLIGRVLSDLARWRTHEPRRRQLAEEPAAADELDREKQRHDALEIELREVQNQLKERAR